jgi:hypothetical protein
VAGPGGMYEVKILSHGLHFSGMVLGGWDRGVPGHWRSEAGIGGAQARDDILSGIGIYTNGINARLRNIRAKASSGWWHGKHRSPMPARAAGVQ